MRSDIIHIYICLKRSSRKALEIAMINDPFFKALHLFRESAVGLFMWLRPKDLKICSYVEKYADFKNQTLIKISWNTN